MPSVAKFLLVCLLSAFSAVLPSAAEEPVVGLNSLPEVEFSRLSQVDPNPLGEKALMLHPDQWKHAETEHFIYHFVHGYVATPVSVEAEFHYRVVAKELEREQPAGDTKSHIYIFEKPADWQAFQGLGELERWTGGIQSAGSLFVLHAACPQIPAAPCISIYRSSGDHDYFVSFRASEATIFKFSKDHGLNG